MSLRDFNSDRPISLQTEPLGNGTGLDSFHTVHPQDVEPSSTPKIVGAVAVALMIGVAGVALYAQSTSSLQPKPVVTASNLPAPAAPAPTPEPAPPASQQAAMTPDVTPANVPTTDNTPAPVKTATVRSHVAASAGSSSGASSARMAAASNQPSTQPQQQAAVIAEPVSPTPPASDVATNNTQSGAAVPQGATTASDMPAATPAGPAPDQAGATPAPAQPPAQSAGQVAQ